MKFLYSILLVLILPFIAVAQCPVIEGAMINACANFPSTAEGINEYVLFNTTAPATAGSYTLYYGSNANPSLSPSNTLSGSNAGPKTGTGTISSTNGCTIVAVTSPSTNIPSGSNVILIPSNFDATYDVTEVCTTGTLYVIYVDITSAPSDTWNPNGSFSNNPGGPRYLQIKNGASNCLSGIQSYGTGTWVGGNVDGNSVWWGGAGGISYQNNGCTIITPPLPTLTPIATGSVCEKILADTLRFTTTGSPNTYSIDWNAAANAAGFVDVSSVTLPASPLSFAIPAGATAGVYNATITGTNTTTSQTSVPQSFSVTVNAPPVVTVQPVDTTQYYCQNTPVIPVTITATAGSGTIITYQWYLNVGNINVAIPGATLPTYTPSSASLGTLRFFCVVTNSNGCRTTSDTSGAFIISPNITKPVATATVQPDCITTTGTIVVTSPVGVNIRYSDGGPYQASGTFTGLAPGTYNITAKNIVTGCISQATAVTIDPLPAVPAAPVAAVTVQPDCIVSTGTIVVSSPTGANYEYSNGGPYQASTSFAGLTNGTTYNITVKDLTTGCISAALPLTVNTIPVAPAAPVASVSTQPTCTAPTGSITISSPTGANYTYSIGGPYQAGVLFTALTPGTTYPVTLTDVSTGCISAPLNLTINAIPAAPTTPVASVTVQPTCTVTTGTIVITSPTGANIQYSIGGAYQAGTTFTGITAATSISITAKDIVTGCVSTAAIVAVAPIPAGPATPVASVSVQPTCSVTTGTIVISSPTGANIEYSIGGAYQSGTTFTGLTAGTSYSITAKDIVTGCISIAAIVAVDPIPAGPATPVASVTVQPTCTIPTGTIVVTSPTGANIQYSNGGAYQAGTTFTGLTAGTPFSITAKDIVTGCISGAFTIAVNAVPAPPSTPVVSVTVQPNCITTNGTLVIISPAGPNIEYSIGGAYQGGTNLYPGLTAGTTYNITARDIITGCISAITTVLINPIPAPPQAPVATVTTQPTCSAPVGTISINSPTGATLEYSNGGAYQASITFTGLVPNTYSITARDISTGCISAASDITVNPPPPVPAAPVVNNIVVCQNKPAGALSATGANILWYTVATGGTGTITAPVLSSATAGNTAYYATQTVNGCESPRATETVTINPTPLAPAVVTPFFYCVNAPAGLLTATGSNLLWYAAATGGTGSSTAPTPTTTSTGNSFYYVSQTNALGCESPRVAITITVNTVITPVTGFRYSPDTVCKNSAITPGPVYDINFKTGGVFSSVAGISVNAATGSINLAASTPGTYLITYTYTANGCILGGSSTSSITINPPVSTNTVFSYSSPICKNDANPSPAFAPGFTTGGQFNSGNGLSVNSATGVINLSTSNPGIYQVTYSLPSVGCRNATSNFSFISINANTVPVTAFNFSPAVVCPGDADPVLTLAPNFNGGGLFTATPAGLALDSVTGEIDMSNSSPGGYIITYNRPKLGCRLPGSSIDTFIIRSVSPPKTSFAYAGPVCKSDAPILPLPDTSLTLGGIFSSATGLSLNPASGRVDLQQSTPGLYQVKYLLPASTCSQADSSVAPLEIFSQPPAPTLSNEPVCGSGQATLRATGPGTINWYSDAAATTLINTGDSLVTVINGAGQRFYLTSTVGSCVSTIAAAGAVISPVPPRPAIGRDTGICKGDIILLSPGQYSSYLWQNGSTQPTFTVSGAGNYSVTVTNSAGCKNTGSINVVVLENCDDIQFPTAFSPNGDGRNEQFGAYGTLAIVKNYTLSIFNRYGELVFQTDNPYRKWDGMYRGKIFGNTNFVWVATYTFKDKTAKTQKGNVMVVR